MLNIYKNNIKGKSKIKNKLFFSNLPQKLNKSSWERIEHFKRKSRRPGLIGRGLEKIGRGAVESVEYVFDRAGKLLTLSNFMLITPYLYIWVLITLLYILFVYQEGSITINITYPEVNAFLKTFWAEKGILAKIKYIYAKIDILTLGFLIITIWRLNAWLELFFFVKFFTFFGNFIKNTISGNEYLFDRNFIEIRRYLDPTEIDFKIENIWNSIKVSEQSKIFVQDEINKNMQKLITLYDTLGSKVADVNVKIFIEEAWAKHQAMLSSIAEKVIAEPGLYDSIPETPLAILLGASFGALITTIYFDLK